MGATIPEGKKTSQTNTGLQSNKKREKLNNILYSLSLSLSQRLSRRDKREDGGESVAGGVLGGVEETRKNSSSCAGGAIEVVVGDVRLNRDSAREGCEVGMIVAVLLVKPKKSSSPCERGLPRTAV